MALHKSSTTSTGSRISAGNERLLFTKSGLASWIVHFRDENQHTEQTVTVGDDDDDGDGGDDDVDDDDDDDDGDLCRTSKIRVK